MKMRANIFLNIFFLFFVIVSIVGFKLKFQTTETILTFGEIEQLSGSARSVVVMEASSRRVLYEKNAHERLLTASIAKILTAITAIENMNLDQYVVIDTTVLEAIGSSLYLKIGDVVSIRDLLYGVMLQSGNDASLMVAQSYSGNIDDFIFRMNEIVKRLQMDESSFENPTGLDEKTKNYSSAHDMALLMSYAMQNPTFRKITSTKSYQFTTADGKLFSFINKHRLIREDKEAIGGKTGYTKKAGRTLVTVFERDGMEIVVCTFDASNDWAMHRELASWAFDEYKMQLVLSAFDFQMSTLHLEPPMTLIKPIYFPLREEEKVETRIQLIDEEAYLTVMQAGKIINRIPLVIKKGK